MPIKHYLSEWYELVAIILRSTSIDPNETEEEKKNRIAGMEADPEAWFEYYFPSYTSSKPAAFHKAATKRVLNNPEWYEVRMWSRELAKTTRTMMEVLYLTLVGSAPGNSPLSFKEGWPSGRGDYLQPKLSTPSLSSREGAEGGRVKEEYPSGESGLNATPVGAQNLVPPNNTPKPVKKKYVLMISSSYDNACRLLLPYRANLEKNARIINDYGPQKKRGFWRAGEFVTQQGIAFRALGAQQSPRGTRNEEARPDVIIFDDIDTDTNCHNPNLIAKKWQWIEEAAISTRSISVPLLTIFCGNRIAADCCIERAVKYASHVDIVNITDENGNSSWPEKNSLADIEKVLKQKSYAARQKEYFNNPIVEGSVFKAMNYKPSRPLVEYSLLVCYTDPSFKDTKKNDYKATVLVGKWKDEYHVIKCFVQQTSTANMVEWHYSIMDFVGHYTCYYFIEENNNTDTLVRTFREATTNKGKPIPYKMDNRAKQDKFTRIESVLEPLHSNGKLFLNENEKNNPNMQTLEEQFVNISPKSRNHDDGPDAVEGAVYILNNKSAVLKSNSFFSVKKPLGSKHW